VRFVLGCLALAVGQLVLAQSAPATFPAQQRPPGDRDAIARGGQLYGVHCRSCHGVDLRGGDLGGPNLLRSQLVLNDKAGEAIVPVVQNGRVPAGGGTVMPPLPLPVDDIKAVAEYLHSVIATSQPQGAPPAGSKQPLNLLVGNARAGQRYFATNCAACHSATGDLAGIGSRVPDPELLQNSWVAARRAGAPHPASAARRQAHVTVSLAGGEQISGALQRADDFIVSLVTRDGTYRSFTRRSATPRIVSVEVDDPLARHRKMWALYTDQNMHDVTAYLATLK
jgi:cytochrome c oxidase cbb3-type subunit 3